MNPLAELVACKADNPTRPPSWRWDLAGLIVERRVRLLKPRRDPWVRRALEFRRAADRYGGHDHPRVARDHAEVVGASVLSLGGDRRARCEVEARLLAGQGLDEVGRRCGLSAAVVGAYEALFFNVCDRLGQRSYILHFAVGPRPHRGLAAADGDVLLKLFAYNGGPLVVDAVVDLFLGPRAGRAAGPVAPRTVALARLAVAALTLPVNPSTARPLVMLHERVKWIEREEASRSAAAVSGPVVAWEWAAPAEVSRRVPATAAYDPWDFDGVTGVVSSSAGMAEADAAVLRFTGPAGDAPAVGPVRAVRPVAAAV